MSKPISRLCFLLKYRFYNNCYFLLSCPGGSSIINIKYIVNYQVDIFLPKDTSTNRKSINVHPKNIKFLLTLSNDENPKMAGMRKLFRCFFMFENIISLFISITKLFCNYHKLDALKYLQLCKALFNLLCL